MKNLITTLTICLFIANNCFALETTKLSILDSSNNIKVSYEAKIADTPKTRQIGLMNVKEMPADKAMLFIWNNYGYRYMWMKNTYIPLDMLFIKDNTIIGMHKNAIPHDLTALGIEAETNKVLEINAGQIEEYNITIGDKIKTDY